MKSPRIWLEGEAAPSTVGTSRSRVRTKGQKGDSRLGVCQRGLSGPRALEAALSCDRRCRSREWPWRHIAIGQFQGPFDRFQVYQVDVRIVPAPRIMRERAVKYTPPSVHLRPGNGKITVLVQQLLVWRQFGRIEPQQDAALLTGEVLDLVKLIGQGENRRQMARCRKVQVLVNHRSLDRAVRVILELSSEHLTELRPGHERCQGNMRGDESLAVVPHELQQVGSLLVVNGYCSVTHEKDSVDVGGGPVVVEGC